MSKLLSSVSFLIILLFADPIYNLNIPLSNKTKFNNKNDYRSPPSIKGNSSNFNEYKYNDLYEPSIGQIVPIPRIQEKTGRSFLIDINRLSIIFEKEHSILQLATERWLQRAFYDDSIEAQECENEITILNINVENISTPLSYNVNQSYYLSVKEGQATISSTTIWGALYGIITFSQIIYLNQTKRAYEIWETTIFDSPEYEYRGILFDTSRHFISTAYLKKNLDAMESVKLNVFHWHIVDDQSFPYVSQKYPEMHQKGAYDPRKKIYTVAEIKEIVEYANIRGINVIPEFDTPGHTSSWYGANESYINCNQQYSWGIIDPTIDATYDFLKEFFKEAKPLFGNNLLHIGGDEVDEKCWYSVPRIAEYAKSMSLTQPGQLQAHYTKRLLEHILDTFDSVLAWDEVFTDSGIIDPKVIVHVWRWWTTDVAIHAISNGQRVVISKDYYFDHSDSDWSWENIYLTNPRAGIPIEKRNFVIGAEVCQWGELASNANIIEDTWVRASVTAERFWSPMSNKIDFLSVLERMDEHHCRLMRMNIINTPLRQSLKCL